MVAAVAAIVLVAGTALALASPHRAAAPPLSPAGARLYELGRYYWNTRSRDGVRKSIEYFSQVIATDPRDARGYAGLAAATAILGDYDYGPAPAKTYYAQARAYAEKALALDPRCARAYAVLGMLSSTSDTPSAQELADAIRQLRHAIELDSSDGPAHEWYGVALLASGRVDEAYGELQKASALDPSSVATTHWLGEAAYFERRYDDAIAYERQALDLAPHFYEAMGSLGLAYEARGDDALAIASFQRMARGCPSCRPEAAALLANVYAHANRPAQARSELAIAAAHPSDVSPEDLALAFAAVGERRVALSWFHRLHGNYAQATLAIDPRFDALRDDPMLARFAQKPA
jgi:tetratricopeptide (TPR) repeat protein